MRITIAQKKDLEFVYETLKVLAGDVKYPIETFKSYYLDYLNNDHSQIYIAEVDDEQIGLITLNRFEMPRYCGYGLEMEEVIIIESMRGKGYGREFIELLKEKVSKDPGLRKMIVKTDDIAGSGKLYARILDQKELVTYQKYINPL
mgnify:CR=1 FL=1